MNTRDMGCALYVHQKECQKRLGCALSTEKYGNWNLSLIAAISNTVSTNLVTTTHFLEIPLYITKLCVCIA
jgi:hypothetical protein